MNLVPVRKLLEGDRVATGFYTDTWEGREAFSDGMALFVGAPPAGSHAFVVKQARFDPLAKEICSELKPTRPTSEAIWIQQRRLLKGFRGGAFIQMQYFDYIEENFPKPKFFLGKARKHKPNERPIVCKVKDNFVAIIMPFTPKPRRKRSAR